MDWLSFTAEMFKAAAWPAVALLITLMFRPQLRALATRLNKGRLGPAEFEFEQALQALAAQSAADESLGSAAAAARTAVPARDATRDATRDAITAAWRELEQAAQLRARALPRPAPLAARDVAMYQQLEQLQAQADAQEQFHPSAQAVNSYVQLARALQARMKSSPQRAG